MTDIVARVGLDFSFEMDAVSGQIQAASASGEFGMEAASDARRSRSFTTLDESIGLVMAGKVFALPTLDDPAGEVVFDLGMDGPSFLVASDFGGGGASGPAPAKDGFALLLGDITQGDGSWLPGAVPLNDDVSLSEAIDRLNETLGLLVPSGPASFPNGVLSVTNATGSSPLLASGGVADNTAGASGYAPGAAVTRITSGGVNSFVFNDVGPGDTGTVSLSINGAVIGSKALTGAGDAGTYNGLLIADQKDYPEDKPGFYKTIDVSAANAPAAIGINSMRLNHSATAQTNVVYFVRDDMTAAPTVSDVNVIEGSAGTLVYSSGVPHYGDGASLTVTASMNNFSGETYYGGADAFSVSSTGGVVNTQSYGYAALGIPTPIPRQTTAVTALSAMSVAVNGSGHTSGQLRGTGRNVNGAGATVALSSATILIKRGSASGKIDETAVAVTGLGSTPNANNAVRKGQSGGDTPAGAAAAWVQNTVPATHEATVVGGVLKHDQTNYTLNTLPAGPNLSVGRAGAQYVTFSFNRAARSAFKIAVTGAYAGCWVKLPGVTDQAVISPNAPNGWMNAFQSYDGSGVPGEAGDPNAGCASGAVMNGGSGTFQITFGTQTSTNSTGNEILVRFRLNAGQSITALSFTA